MPYMKSAQGFKGVADVFLRDPARYASLLQFIETVMTSPSALTKAEREIIAAHVSKINGCGFCLGAHRWTLVAMDVDTRVIEAVENGADDEGIDARLRPILRFATKLTQRPGEVGQRDIDELLEAGWSEQTVEDAINVISLFNYVNRLVDAFGIEGEESYFRQIGAALAKRGYGPLIETALARAS